MGCKLRRGSVSLVAIRFLAVRGYRICFFMLSFVTAPDDSHMSARCFVFFPVRILIVCSAGQTVFLCAAPFVFTAPACHHREIRFFLSFGKSSLKPMYREGKKKSRILLNEAALAALFNFQATEKR